MTSYSLANEGGRLRLEGALRTEDAPNIWRDLQTAEGSARELDLSGVTALPGNVAALISSTRLEIVGVPEQLAPVVDLYRASDKDRRKKRKPESMVAQVGRVTLDYVNEAKQVLAFFGEMVLAGAAIIRRPRSAHWKEVPPLIEKTGADALPIVALINFLVGFVMAYQAAQQLKMFGANIYAADLVGLSVTRELAPLMTAIIVCGRSGAAFTAEIGTMKVGEEIDALRTFGLRPFAWIVVPRVIALVVVVPVLTLLADLIGVLGGLFVAVTSLDLTVAGYMIETKKAVFSWDVNTGLIKSFAFAIAIALIACQQGFATAGGAEGVGQRTTSTVVKCLFVLVLLDATFTMIFRAFGV